MGYTSSAGLGSDARAQVYSEDVVTYVDASDAAAHDAGDGLGAIGLVSRVAGESDDDESDGSDEEWSDDYASDDDDASDADASAESREARREARRTRDVVPDAHAKVCWLDLRGDERVVHEKNESLRVLDRAFLHGDVVARASDALGQTGVVIHVDVDVDLRFVDGARVRDVAARRMTHVRDHRPGHYVVHGRWVGRVEEVRRVRISALVPVRLRSRGVRRSSRTAYFSLRPPLLAFNARPHDDAFRRRL